MIHFFGKIQGVSLSDHFCKLLFPEPLGVSLRRTIPALPMCASPGTCKTCSGYLKQVLVQEQLGGRKPELIGVLLCWTCMYSISCHCCHLPCEGCIVTSISPGRRLGGCRVTKLACDKAQVWPIISGFEVHAL